MTRRNDETGRPAEERPAGPTTISRATDFPANAPEANGVPRTFGPSGIPA